jgi:cellobiose-specific phosphotransferase system component IIA
MDRKMNDDLTKVFMDALDDHPAMLHMGCFHQIEAKLISSFDLDEDEKLALSKFPIILQEIQENKEYSEALQAYKTLRAEMMETPLRAPSGLLQERHRKKGELVSQMIEIISVTLLTHAISPGEIFYNRAH